MYMSLDRFVELTGTKVEEISKNFSTIDGLEWSIIDRDGYVTLSKFNYVIHLEHVFLNCYMKVIKISIFKDGMPYYSEPVFDWNEVIHKTREICSL